jgi:hypothetical protein
VGDAFVVKNDCPVHGLDALAAELDKLTPEEWRKVTGPRSSD